jgi:hydantoinase/oxoprolinase-like protein
LKPKTSGGRCANSSNPAHELRVQEVFLSEYPAHQLGAIPLSDLEQNLREHGYPRPMLIIHNSGCMAQLNSTDALQTIHSGPVAGISASEHLAAQAGLADLGEQEIIEDDVPFLQLISKKIKRDAQGFGRYRGGMGYEIAVAARGTPLWGFATVSSGSKFPAIPGLFGGYGCPAYPLAKISTHHMGMGFELADEGELYLICQGTGGGYGDVLERDPEAVMADVEAGYLSSEAAARSTSSAMTPPRWRWTPPGRTPPAPPNARPGCAGARPTPSSSRPGRRRNRRRTCPTTVPGAKTTASSMPPPGPRKARCGWRRRPTSSRRSSCPTPTSSPWPCSRRGSRSWRPA